MCEWALAATGGAHATSTNPAATTVPVGVAQFVCVQKRQYAVIWKLISPLGKGWRTLIWSQSVMSGI